MTLVLSSADQTQLVATLEALLSPLASSSAEAWFHRIAREMRTLCHGDTTLLCAVHEGQGGNYSEDAPALAAAMNARIGFRGGEIHFHDPSLDVALIERRRRSASVFTSATMERGAGGGYFDSEFYNEVAIPCGARVTLALAIGGAEGEVLLGVNNGSGGLDPLSEDTLALLALVVPAFRAGFETLSRLAYARRTLTTTLDTLADGMLVFSLSDGRELHRNHALSAMLAEEPERGAVEQRILRLARAVRELRRNGTQTAPQVVPAVDEVVTTRARYQLRASFLAPGTFSHDGTAVVAVQAPPPALPTVAALRARFRLTQREAEVARKLAMGDSDAHLALDLGISPHTVRHHTESVFAKLGVHSRKALALHLAR